MEDLLGERYRLDAIAGHGGMAVVYEGYDLLLERRIAIKYFQTHLLHEPVLLARFRREALAAAKIVHSNVVAIHDTGVGDDERPYIIMEYVDGPTIAHLLRSGPLAPARVAHLGAGIARGLSAAHALGFVHRDVKPANVLVADGERAKLTDFGLVRADGEHAPDGLAAALTADGAMIGSHRYVAPEQLDDGSWSAASDCFALGATLYQMLTATVPQPDQRLATEFVSDAELRDVVETLLRRDPAARHADAATIAETLDAIAMRLRYNSR